MKNGQGNGLRVRVTPTGKKTFVFEQSLKNQSIRRTIGEVSAWSIPDARAEAKRLSVMLDSGTDPRELEREQAEVKTAARVAAEARAAAQAAQAIGDALTVAEVWAAYIAERSPHWGELHLRDHNDKAKPGGLPHARACAAAGLDGLTLHGLRRSFASLTEWLEVPAGVVAQVMGHKPSATAEKHYKRRPLDLLRQWHTKAEVWMLEQAGVTFDATAAPGALRVVAAQQ